MGKNLIDGFLKAIGNSNASLVSNGTIYDGKSYIDTGCYMLNAQISGSIYGGLPSNRITAIAGEESTGKTFLLLGIKISKHFFSKKDCSTLSATSKASL